MGCSLSWVGVDGGRVQIEVTYRSVDCEEFWKRRRMLKCVFWRTGFRV